MLSTPSAKSVPLLGPSRAVQLGNNVVGGGRLQWPAAQTPPAWHGVVESHGAPSGLGRVTQAPEIQICEATQSLGPHRVPSGRGTDPHPALGSHVAEWQESLGQVIGTCAQPETSLHESNVHTLPSSQLTGCPRHSPSRQVPAVKHALAQGEPFETATCTHAPVGSTAPKWHASAGGQGVWPARGTRRLP